LLVRENGCFRDKSVSGHSLTLGETVEASSALIDGATAFEVSGLDSNFFAVFTHLDEEILNCLESSSFLKEFSLVVCLLFSLRHCLSLLC